MIQSFKDKETAKVWSGERSKKLPPDIQKRGQQKLRFLNAAARIEDLRFPPSNYFEALKDNRKGQYSIRINNQWRVCFEFENGNVYNVEITDYHK